MPYTLVTFHAHPDDEALLTAGTMARAVAEGHRVVLVTATAGEAGLTATEGADASELGERRMAELRASAAALGCSEVHFLGFDDSGMDGRSGRDGHAFARVPVDDAAEMLADLLKSVAADVLTVYDPSGGYGHPDHIQVRMVGVRAAELAGTPVVLEATVDRRAIQKAVRIARALRLAPSDWSPERFASAYSEPSRLTHRIDVRAYADAKRRSMAAHASQTTADAGVRSLALYLRLPEFVYRRVFGREWFVELGRTPTKALLGDIFTTLNT